MEKLDQELGKILNANDLNLQAFKKAGGKLLMLHGMADPIIPYKDSLEYYRQVAAYEGGIEETKTYFRYFMIPGLDHVVGGPGVQDITAYGFRATPCDSDHDTLVALENWVKNGTAPERLLPVAFKDGNLLNGIRMGTYEYERPCYAYPEHARYTGGDVNCIENYERMRYEG